MFSLALVFAESCFDGTCAQDEATLFLLQTKGFRHHKHLQEPDADDVLWRQIFIDRTKCNRNIGVQLVNSQFECQAVAQAAGHDFYSFRHNAGGAGQRHSCFSSQNCDDENGLRLGNRQNEWRVYRRPFPNPAVIRNAYSGRRVYAQVSSNQQEGVGALDGEELHANQRWVIEDAGDGNDAYIIRNEHSNRRLYAQDSGNGQNDLGAMNQEASLHDDQKWFIVPTDDGKYIIRNFLSGRRLYAQADREGAQFGAITGEVYADQKWFIDSTDNLPDGVQLALMQPGKSE